MSKGTLAMDIIVILGGRNLVTINTQCLGVDKRGIKKNQKWWDEHW